MSNPKQGPKIQEKRLSPFEEYLYANLCFWGLLVVVAIVGFFACGAVWDDVTSGAMEFLFLIVGGGFTFVSILDYFYERNIPGAS
jgi:type III secretory pathway component EscU